MQRMLYVIFLFLPLVAFGQKPVERSQILVSAEWKQEYDLFTPDPQMLSALDQQLQEKASIDVYLGFWCSDSQTQVPRFLKIVDQLKNRDNLKIRYFSIDRKSTQEQKYYVKDKKIERIPTFIGYREGKEIGRIVETPRFSMEEDLLNILF